MTWSEAISQESRQRHEQHPRNDLHVRTFSVRVVFPASGCAQMQKHRLLPTSVAKSTTGTGTAGTASGMTVSLNGSAASSEVAASNSGSSWAAASAAPAACSAARSGEPSGAVCTRHDAVARRAFVRAAAFAAHPVPRAKTAAERAGTWRRCCTARPARSGFAAARSMGDDSSSRKGKARWQMPIKFYKMRQLNAHQDAFLLRDAWRCLTWGSRVSGVPRVHRFCTNTRYPARGDAAASRRGVAAGPDLVPTGCAQQGYPQAQVRLKSPLSHLLKTAPDLMRRPPIATDDCLSHSSCRWCGLLFLAFNNNANVSPSLDHTQHDAAPGPL